MHAVVYSDTENQRALMDAVYSDSTTKAFVVGAKTIALLDPTLLLAR